MSQADIIKLLEEKIIKLEKKLQKTLKEEEKIDLIWDESVTRDDIAMFLGISVTAVAKNIQKLLLEDEIISLRRETDKRKRRYLFKDENIINMVNNRDD